MAVVGASLVIGVTAAAIGAAGVCRSKAARNGEQCGEIQGQQFHGLPSTIDEDQSASHRCDFGHRIILVEWYS